MKIEAPANENYAATVVRLPALNPLEGCDNLVAAPLYGFQAIVDKSHLVGELGVVFGAECQLSDDFCRVNNLYRHADKNADETASPGYLEDNRRVRALKLRGHRSDCLFLPLEALAYTGARLSDLKEGDTFDKLNGVEVCQKYVIKTKGSSNQRPQEKKFSRVDPKLFPEHIDTANYWRNSHVIAPGEWVHVTQKVHGTSWRGTRTKVLRKLTLRDKIAKWLGVKVDQFEWDSVAGSRKVIKDPHNPDQNHFYASDIWTEYLASVEEMIPEGFVLYGEIIGWTSDGAAIQTGYTYDQAPGTNSLYIYRVAQVNPRGVTTDLSWPQVREFCRDRGLKYVPDLWAGWHRDFDPDQWIDLRLNEEGYLHALPLSGSKKMVDEGVCVRADGLVPRILKAKSPIFLAHETKLLDKGEVNLEDVGSEVLDSVDETVL